MKNQQNNESFKQDVGKQTGRYLIKEFPLKTTVPLNSLFLSKFQEPQVRYDFNVNVHIYFPNLRLLTFQSSNLSSLTYHFNVFCKIAKKQQSYCNPCFFKIFILFYFIFFVSASSDVSNEVVHVSVSLVTLQRRLVDWIRDFLLHSTHLSN